MGTCCCCCGCCSGWVALNSYTGVGLGNSDLSLDDIHESFKIFVPTSPPGVGTCVVDCLPLADVLALNRVSIAADTDWVQGQLKRIARHIYMHHASLDMVRGRRHG